MNPILKEMIETGYAKGPNGERVKLHSQIPSLEGEFFQELISQCKPTVTLEVGLAFGVSSLYICDALEKKPDTRHIVIDPWQYDARWWGGIGIHNIREAGYGSIVEFFDIPSYQALPRLEKEKREIEFAFVDGMHTFDYCFTDFFYIDKILKVGGLIAFDDANIPSIRKLCRYIVTNHPYTVFKCLETYDKPRVSIKRAIFNTTFLRFLRAINYRLNILMPEVATTDIELGLYGRCIVLRKESEDKRTNPAAFVPF